MAENKLYYVRYEDLDYDGGENQDDLVVASNKAGAIALWREYREYEDTVKPDWVGEIPGVVPTRSAGVIEWAEINPQ